jgi:hypothetical protein
MQGEGVAETDEAWEIRQMSDQQSGIDQLRAPPIRDSLSLLPRDKSDNSPAEDEVVRWAKNSIASLDILWNRTGLRCTRIDFRSRKIKFDYETHAAPRVVEVTLHFDGRDPITVDYPYFRAVAGELSDERLSELLGDGS